MRISRVVTTALAVWALAAAADAKTVAVSAERLLDVATGKYIDKPLVAIVPEKEDYKDSQGPVKAHAEGKTVIFDPIEKLAPHADAILRINVKAREQGVVYFKILVTSTNLVQAVEKSESTRIYSDAPDAAK